MSLTSALDTAKSSLIATQTHTALVSRNIANLNDPGATRKYANVVTGPGGRVEIASIARSQNTVLFRNMLDSSSSVGAWSAIASGYQRIDETIGDTNLARSPAARISNLADSLFAYSSNPGSFEFARAALDAGRDLVTGLNELSATVETIRRDADSALSEAAGEMNRLLAEIEQLNGKVVSGTIAGSDVTDFADKRDQAVAKLADHVGLSARIRGNNDLVLSTDSGVTLFDGKARLVEFTPTSPLVPGQKGASLRIDGVQVTGEGAYMPLKSGSIVGLTTLRDDVAMTYQNQLDEIARGLVLAFAEDDGGVLKAGVFTTGTNGADIASLRNDTAPGLAGRIAIDSTVLADPTKLRSGVNVDFANGAGSGFTARILSLYDGLNASRDILGPNGQIESRSLSAFAASAHGSLQAGRAAALSEVEYKTTLLERTKETLSNETGVNMAQEMTLLTDLQRSYQASAKLISTVDEMLATLLQSV